MPKILRIGLFMGGASSEKEISLETGRHVYNSLDRVKFEVVPIFVDHLNHFFIIDEGLMWMNTCADVEAQLSSLGQRLFYEDLKSKIDYAFLALHGKYGEECLPGLLELFAIPNNSSGVLGGILGMDKVFQKKLLQANGLTVGKYLGVSVQDWKQNKEKLLHKVEEYFSYPFIVKPSREGCSVAITKVTKRKEIEKAFAAAFTYDNVILLEEYLKGTEVTTTVIEENGIPRVLTPTETPYKGDFLSVEEKFLPGDATMITPPNLPKEDILKIQSETLKAYMTLRQGNCSRIDGIYKEGKLYILEPNSPPGMTPSTMVFHQAAEEGWNASDFFTKIIENRT